MRYTTIIYEVKKELEITLREYIFLDIVYHLQVQSGWCYAKNSYFGEILDVGDREVRKIRSSLSERGLIISSENYNSNEIKTTTKWNNSYLNIENDAEQKVRSTRTKKSAHAEQKVRSTIYKESYNKIDIADDSKEPSKFNPLGADLIKEMEKIDPKNKKYYNNRSQRQAADFLIEEYTYEKSIELIKLLPQLKNSIPYMPSITTPCELRDKWQKVMDSIQRYRTISKSKIKETSRYAG